MRSSAWSSDVGSSDLHPQRGVVVGGDHGLEPVQAEALLAGLGQRPVGEQAYGTGSAAAATVLLLEVPAQPARGGAEAFDGDPTDRGTVALDDEDEPPLGARLGVHGKSVVWGRGDAGRVDHVCLRILKK